MSFCNYFRVCWSLLSPDIGISLPGLLIKIRLEKWVEWEEHMWGGSSYLDTPPQHWGFHLEEGLEVRHAWLAALYAIEGSRDNTEETLQTRVQTSLFSNGSRGRTLFCLILWKSSVFWGEFGQMLDPGLLQHVENLRYNSYIATVLLQHCAHKDTQTTHKTLNAF